MAVGRRKLRYQALTLLELLVVVAILAVLATVAVRSTSDFGQQARYDATQATLKTFRDAVIGPANQQTPDGTPFTTGFIADMGRPPRATLTSLTFPTSTASVPDLPELYSGTLPSNLKAYALYNAASSNVITITNFPIITNSTMSLLYDTAMYLGAGWRGPYLAKPASSATYVDGWGKYLVSRTDLGTQNNQIQLWQTMLITARTNQSFSLDGDLATYTATTTAGWDVLGWVSWSGFDGQAMPPTDPYYNRFYSVVGTNEYVAPITVQVTCSPTFGTLTGSSSNFVQLATYGPSPSMATDASHRPLQCAVFQTGYSSFTSQFNLTGANAPTIGTRIFRAWLRYNGTNYASRLLYFPVRPGFQTVNIALP
jgi:prepilin-type N-terminal cleavage/methylation domain-containing protein